MERTVLPAAAADEQAPPVSQPVPAEAPIAHYWQVFDRLFASAVERVTADTGVAVSIRRRHMQHAFYAGARAGFASVMDAFREIEADDPQGDTRLAAVEREVEAYFRDIAGRALISPTGKVDK